MNRFLAELSAVIESGRHAALLIDNAGWHTAKELIIPSNITLIPLHPYSPELNPTWYEIRSNDTKIIKFRVT
jgi:transposase